MYQPWIFATTLAAGGGLVAYAVTLHPAAPVDIAPEPPAAVRVVPPPAPAPVPEPKVTEEPVMQLAPVVIQARVHRKPVVAAPPPVPVDVPAERPCSTWRDIGPTHVMSGNPSGELQVRSLCQ